MKSLALLLALSTCAIPAYAEPKSRCVATQEAYAFMIESGKERLLSLMQPDGSVIEIWVTQEGEWIMFGTLPTGQSCFIAGGAAHMQSALKANV